MLLKVLSFTYYTIAILFGFYISAFFLGVKQNRKNILTLFLLALFEGILYMVVLCLMGRAINDQYVIILHLMLIVSLVLYYKYSVVSSCVSVFSAYLCCQLSNWIGLLVWMITGEEWSYYVSQSVITVIVFFLLCRYVCHTTEIIFARDTRELYIIGFLPTVYYLFDYFFAKLSGLLYSGNKVLVEFMGFVFCISYLVFLIVYFREYEKRQEMKRYSDLMEMQFLSIQKEIKQVKRSKQKLSILRHDMRHHLNIILIQLQNDNVEKAIDYIEAIGDSSDDTTIMTYCKNEIINSVVSIYQTWFAEKEIALKCDISVGEGELPCPDMAIGTILSNALENSMHALEEMDMEEKWINLSVCEKKDHLLLEIENPIVQIPRFVDGVPTSGKKGHGIGVKSIVYYVEQLKGQCHFSATDHSFVLRIII